MNIEEIGLHWTFITRQ